MQERNNEELTGDSGHTNRGRGWEVEDRAQKYRVMTKNGILRGGRLRGAGCSWGRMAGSEAKQGSGSKTVRGSATVLRSVDFNREPCGEHQGA